MAQSLKYRVVDTAGYNRVIDYLNNSLRSDPVKDWMVTDKGYQIEPSKNLFVLSSDTSPFVTIEYGNKAWIFDTRVRDGVVNAMNTLKIDRVNDTEVSDTITLEFKYEVVKVIKNGTDKLPDNIDTTLKYDQKGEYELMIKTYTIEGLATSKIQVTARHPFK